MESAALPSTVSSSKAFSSILCFLMRLPGTRPFISPSQSTERATMATPPRASLLGLPRELRDQIYHAVLTSELDISLTKSGGLFDCATFARAQPGALDLPWLNLRLVCRTTNADVISYLDNNKDVQTADAENLRTYAMDLNFSAGDLKTVTWRRIPCEPGQARRIVAYGTAPEHTCWGGDGGPGQPANSLWYVLNDTLHYGPQLGGRALKEHMYVPEVHLRIHQEGNTSKHFGAYGYISRMMHVFSWPGFLCGFVDKFIVSNEENSEEILVENCAGGVVPEEWVRYGFRWGAKK